MKNKKIFSLISAVCLATSMIAPTVSSAIFDVQDIDSPALERYNDTERYTRLDKKYNRHFLSHYNENQIENSVLYASTKGNSVYALIPHEKMGDYAVFSFTEGTTEEEVKEFLSQKFNNYYTIHNYGFNSDSEYEFSCSFKYLKEVCQLLKEENFIDSFEIPCKFVQFLSFHNTITSERYARAIKYYPVDDEKYAVLNDYVEKNNIGSLLCMEKSLYYLDVEGTEKTEDVIETMVDIYEKTGIRATYTTPAVWEEAAVDFIDVFNSIDGDANEDGNTNIADATAIIQAIGNPDKYALTAQGYFNADIDGDGLTGLDAVAIQRKLAGI